MPNTKEFVTANSSPLSAVLPQMQKKKLQVGALKGALPKFPEKQPLLSQKRGNKAQEVDIKELHRQVMASQAEKQKLISRASELGFLDQGRAISKSFDPGTARVIYEMQPLARADLVKAGAPSGLLSNVSLSMDVPKERLIKILGLSRSTVSRKIADKADFSMDDSERIVGLVKLVGQVEKMDMESGDPKGFDAAKWFGRWIEQPEAALAGRKPADLMDSSDGREAVSRLLAQMQSGAYA